MPVPYPRTQQKTTIGWTGANADRSARGGGSGPGDSQPYAWVSEAESSIFGAVTRSEHFFGSIYTNSVAAVHEAEDTAERVADVAQACWRAIYYAPKTIEHRIGMDVEELKKAFIPGLIVSLAIVTLTTSVGAGVGALLGGALTGGTLAVPAAIGGGELGFDAGMLILDALGIGFLLKEIFDSIPKIFETVKHGVQTAWNAGSGSRHSAADDIDRAARQLADAEAELVNIILQGVLMWILSKSAVATKGKLAAGVKNLKDPGALAARGREVSLALKNSPAAMRATLEEGAAELAAILRRTKLTEGLADFIEKRIEPILESVTKDAEKNAPKPRSADIGGRESSPAPSSKRPASELPPNQAPSGTWEYQPKKTGRLEPGAVPENQTYLDQMTAANTRMAPPAPDGFPQMPNDVAQTFGADPTPVTLDPGTKLYRVIGSDQGSSGSYWSLDPPPETEAEWRGQAAVLDSFNGDGGYVESTVSEEGLNAWSGPTAPQPSAVPGNVVPGGGTQIWVPRGTITPDGPPSPTPWNN